MAENPYESSKVDNPPEESIPVRSKVFRRLPFIVLVGVILLLGIALLIPATRTAREAGRRNQCLSNLKQIALALHNYYDEHGSLPPAYTVDEEGNRLHSWRTLLLPYIKEQALYETIDLTKPWDHPDNALARETVVYPFNCPSSNFEETLTTYLAVVGPDCAFRGSELRRFEECEAGLSNIIAVVDVVPTQPVHWMSPNDIGIEEFLAMGEELKSFHPNIIQAVYLDGHAGAISTESTQKVWRELLSVKENVALENEATPPNQ